MKMPKYLEDTDSFQPDKDAGNLIDKYLGEPLQLTLKDDFAERVSFKYARQFELRQRLVQFLIYFGVIIGGILTGTLVVYFFNPEMRDSWLIFVSGNIYFIFQALIIAVFILFVDKVLLPMSISDMR